MDTDLYAPASLYDQIGKKQRELIKKRLEKLQPLFDLGAGIFDEKIRGACIQEMAARGLCTKPTAYALLRAWFRGGMTKATLTTKHDQCGTLKYKSERADPKSKPGRPRRKGFGIGVPVTAALRRQFAIATGALPKNERSDTGTIFSKFLDMFHREHAVPHKTHGLVPAPGTDDILPTREQVDWYVKTQKKDYAAAANRQARRKMSKELRMFLDSSMRNVTGPGSRYQIDATIIDVYCVSRFNRNLIVGRPTLYVVVDVFSGLIVGLWVSLDSPNWISAAKALVNCLEDKVALYASFGLDIPDALLVSPGLAAIVLGDRGEMASIIAEALIHATDTVLENAPPYCPVAKGLVESMFRTLVAKLAGTLPEWVRPDYKERGGPDYRLDAKLTIDELHRLLLLEAVRRNIDVRHGKSLDPELIMAGVAASPLELWNYGCEHLGLQAKRFDPEVVRIQLLPQKTGLRVTSRGIRVLPWLQYWSHELAAQPWIHRYIAEKKPVSVKYNPDLTNFAYLTDPLNPRRTYTLELTPHCKHFADKTVAEVEALRKRSKDINDLAERRSVFNEANITVQSQAITANATLKAAADLDPSISDAQRTSNIRANRAKERNSYNATGAARPALPGSAPTAISAEADEPTADDETAMLSAQLDQALQDRNAPHR